MPSLKFPASRTIAYEGKQYAIELNLRKTVTSPALVLHIAAYRKQLTRLLGDKEATKRTGISNADAHNYKTGRSKGITIKKILVFCSTSGVWPHDLPGLPADIAQYLSQALYSLAWQPGPEHFTTFPKLGEASESDFLFAAESARYTAQKGSLDTWVRLDKQTREGLIRQAQQKNELMRESAQNHNYCDASKFHIAMHKLFVFGKWEHLHFAGISSTIQICESYYKEREMDFFDGIYMSHKELIDKYRHWDSIEQIAEASAYLDSRHINRFKIFVS